MLKLNKLYREHPAHFIVARPSVRVKEVNPFLISGAESGQDQTTTTDDDSSEESGDESFAGMSAANFQLVPLDLVWAKCRGYQITKSKSVQMRARLRSRLERIRSIGSKDETKPRKINPISTGQV